MSAYLITYDLNKVGQKYKEVDEEIKKMGVSVRYLDSTWFVKSSLTSQEIVQKLKQHFDKNDKLFVVEIGKNRQGLLTPSEWTYLKDNVFN